MTGPANVDPNGTDSPTDPQTGAVHTTTWLRSAALADGRVVDVGINGVTGTITAVIDARRDLPRSAQPAPPADPALRPTEVDLEGYLLLPAPAEPHAHLDKVLTSEFIKNPGGDLIGAIEAWIAHSSKITIEGMVERARRGVLELVASGITAVRSHANVHLGLGTDAIEALLMVREELRHLVDIQIVALTGRPITGPEGADHRALLKDALLMDREIVAGGCPHIDDDPDAATDIALESAGEFDRMLDLHTDETLDAGHLGLRYLAARVAATGFMAQATASHCVSLGIQTPDVQRAVSHEVAEAGVAVITLPQTNLFLQGRQHPTSAPRGLTALRPLLDAGAIVGAGADNVRDPFCTMGRSDPFETAALLVMAGHLLPGEAFHAVTDGARLAMGLPVVRIEPGYPAELVAVLGASLDDAIARADQQRMTWHRGRLVSSTAVERRILPAG